MAEKQDAVTTEGGSSSVLREEKLRNLAELIHYQEVNSIKCIPFKSEYERGHSLRQSREAYLKIMSHLDDGNQLLEATKTGQAGGIVVPQSSSDNDQDTPTAVDLVVNYISNTQIVVEFSLVAIKCIDLRLHYLGKLEDFAQEQLGRMKGLEELNPYKARAAAAELVHDFAAFQKSTYMEEIIKNRNYADEYLARSMKLLPQSFDQLVHQQHMKFVLEKGAEFDKPFQELTTEQQTEVFEGVLESHGEQGISGLASKVNKGLSVAGKVMWGVTIALAAYEIYTSKDKVYTAGKVLAQNLAAYDAGLIVDVAVDAIVAAAVPAAIVEGSLLAGAIVTGGALVIGIAAGVAAAWLVGFVMDHFHKSGGKHTGGVGKPAKPNTLQPHPPEPISKLHIYFAPMPDGAALARRLAYSGGS